MLDLQNAKGAKRERGWWLTDPSSNREAFGMVLHRKGGTWTVARTLIGSPAEKAGIVAGEHFISVDGYEVGGGKGDMLELQRLMALDSSPSHQVTFQGNAGTLTRELTKASLRQLLEYEYDNGGSHLDTCVGCRTCRPVTIGATDCSSGCPGNYCTVA
ncbi:hypothetical protein [Paraburkholderia youngii]|uniref:PDZ domain-containing protein n=1 Tax=Paraburkholderia youngii TaxID=2782701 RepID=A0ABX2NQ56_9BURK|nr:hypothetical protein [Paraburkholderia youngii]NVI06333.1 hypothetical protein [Paraburkholderia youngii]